MPVIRQILGNPLGVSSGDRLATSLPKPFRTRVRCGSAIVPYNGTIPRSQPDASSLGHSVRMILGKIADPGIYNAACHPYERLTMKETRGAA